MIKSVKSFLNSFNIKTPLDKPNIILNIKPTRIVDGKIITGKGRRLKALPRPLLPTQYIPPPPPTPQQPPIRPIPLPRKKSKRPVPAERPIFLKAIEKDIFKFKKKNYSLL